MIKLLYSTLLFVGGLLCAWLMTRCTMGMALARNHLDEPNARSSHGQPTPKGGGVSFVLLTLVMTLIFCFAGWFTWQETLVIGLGGALISVVGFIDDIQHVAAHWRLIVQAFALCLLLWVFGPMPYIHMAGMTFQLTEIMYFFTGFFLLWWINLYNFMDGIDGLAALEGCCLCIGSIVIFFQHHDHIMIGYTLLLGSFLIGFLIYNFPPAKIFMGDVGSGFLGFIFAVLMLFSVVHYHVTFWVWFIFMGLFICDGTVTLLVRLFRRQKIYEAHCDHAYQHAAKRFGHRSVTLACMIINLLWLLPLGTLAEGRPSSAYLFAAMAYIPLLICTIIFRSGCKWRQSVLTNAIK